MNRLKFILKFIVSKQNTGKYNWNLLFPFAGVIIGCFTVALTLAVMEGMEYAIFTKLENISFPGKLMNINSIITEELEAELEILISNSFELGSKILAIVSINKRKIENFLLMFTLNLYRTKSPNIPEKHKIIEELEELSSNPYTDSKDKNKNCILFVFDT